MLSIQFCNMLKLFKNSNGATPINEFHYRICTSHWIWYCFHFGMYNLWRGSFFFRYEKESRQEKTYNWRYQFSWYFILIKVIRNNLLNPVLVYYEMSVLSNKYIDMFLWYVCAHFLLHRSLLPNDIFYIERYLSYLIYDVKGIFQKKNFMKNLYEF